MKKIVKEDKNPCQIFKFNITRRLDKILKKKKKTYRRDDKKEELISYASIYQSLLPIYIAKNITEKFGSSLFFINYILLHII